MYLVFLKSAFQKLVPYMCPAEASHDFLLTRFVLQYRYRRMILKHDMLWYIGLPENNIVYQSKQFLRLIQIGFH